MLKRSSVVALQVLAFIGAVCASARADQATLTMQPELGAEYEFTAAVEDKIASGMALITANGQSYDLFRRGTDGFLATGFGLQIEGVLGAAIVPYPRRIYPGLGMVIYKIDGGSLKGFRLPEVALKQERRIGREELEGPPDAQRPLPDHAERESVRAALPCRHRRNRAARRGVPSALVHAGSRLFRHGREAGRCLRRIILPAWCAERRGLLHRSGLADRRWGPAGSQDLVGPDPAPGWIAAAAVVGRAASELPALMGLAPKAPDVLVMFRAISLPFGAGWLYSPPIPRFDGIEP